VTNYADMNKPKLVEIAVQRGLLKNKSAGRTVPVDDLIYQLQEADRVAAEAKRASDEAAAQALKEAAASAPEAAIPAADAARRAEEQVRREAAADSGVPFLSEPAERTSDVAVALAHRAEPKDVVLRTAKQRVQEPQRRTEAGESYRKAHAVDNVVPLAERRFSSAQLTQRDVRLAQERRKKNNRRAHKRRHARRTGRPAILPASR
jgi:pyruvate/2-oxoglutarate dehydrogenase complex dihydrolipoamide acyltransferase (E2) component